MNIVTEKCCTKCGEVKYLSEFNKDKTKKCGHSSNCKECAKNAARAWYLNNKERAHIWKINRYWSDPEKARASSIGWYKNNTERANKSSTLWQTNNPEKTRESSKKWNSKNKEKVSLGRRIWRILNPDKVRVERENRRSRIVGNGGIISEKEWKDMKAFYNYTCLCCKRREPEIKLTLDHVVPLFLGGKNVIENAQPLCQSCNSKKHRKIIDYR